MNKKLNKSFDPSKNPPAISSVVGPIDKRLIHVLNTERTKWVAVDASLVEPFDALEALIFSGGKRIRPAFFHWRMLVPEEIPTRTLPLMLPLLLKCCMHLHLQMMM